MLNGFYIYIYRTFGEIKKKIYVYQIIKIILYILDLPITLSEYKNDLQYIYSVRITA